MRGASWALAALALLAAAALPFPAPAAAAGASSVNVVSAKSFGCSPDSFTSPDLRVTVLIDGQPSIQTGKAQDEEEPLFAQLASVATPSSPVQVTIRVEEAEPGGFFFVGTTWVHCDTAPGSAQDYTFAWDGGQRTVAARGDAGDAAEAVVVFGSGAPAAPKVSATDLQATTATLAWDSGSGAGHRVAWGFLGGVVATVPPGTSSHTLTGLCDNAAYAVRVVRDLDPWHVASEDVQFRTGNAAPSPPEVTSAKADNGSIAMRVYLPASHDLQTLEVFGGSTSDVSTSGTPMLADEDGPWMWSWSGKAPGTAAYVRVRVTDSGGLSSVSPSFQVGSPDKSSGDPDHCPTEQPVSAPPAQGSASTSSTSASASASTSTTSTSSASTTSQGIDPVDSRSSTTSAVDPLAHATFGPDSDGRPLADGDGDSPEGEPTLSIPFNAGTIAILAGVAILLGVLLGLALRRR